MKINTIKNSGIILFFTILWFLFDYISKLWVISDGFVPIVFIKKFFYFTYQQNTGIAFGIPLPQWLQLISSVLILGVLMYFAYKYVFENKNNRFFKLLLLGMVFGGAIGNGVDRLFKGYVVDFIYLYPIPVFNIADLGITVSLIILLFLAITESDKN